MGYEKISQDKLLNFLRNTPFSGKFIDRLKIYYRPIISPFSKLICIVHENDKVVDVGCGSGQFCLLLAEFARPAHIYGIEVTNRLVNNAKQLFEKNAKTSYEFDLFDGLNFPEKVKNMDVIFLNDVLHHVSTLYQHKFIDNLVLQMKKGAKLVIKDIDKDSLLVYWNRLHDILFSGQIGTELSLNTILSWLQNYELKIISVYKERIFLYPHYTIIVEKL